MHRRATKPEHTTKGSFLDSNIMMRDTNRIWKPLWSCIHTSIAPKPIIADTKFSTASCLAADQPELDSYVQAALSHWTRYSKNSLKVLCSRLVLPSCILRCKVDANLGKLQQRYKLDYVRHVQKSPLFKSSDLIIVYTPPLLAAKDHDASNLV